MCGLLAFAAEGRAQALLAPPGGSSQFTPVSQSFNTLPSSPIAPVAGLIETLGPRLILDLHPSVLYTLTYGDGIPAGPGQHVNTTIQTVTPGMELDVGDHWSLVYSANLINYSSSQFSDEVDQTVTLSGRTKYQDWGFNFSQAYSTSDSVLVETEAQTKVETYTTSLLVSRQLGGQFSTQFGLNQTFQFASEQGSAQSLRQWSASGALNYSFWSGFYIGITGSGGVDLISPGSDMTFEQVQGSATWKPGTKLTLSLSAGAEDTEIMGSQLVSPTFSASLSYQPFAHTTATFTAGRTVNPSFYQDLVTDSTTLSASLNQRLFQHFVLTANLGYTTTPYVGFALISDANAFNLNGAPLAATTSTTRRDDSTFVYVSLGTSLFKKGSLTVFYQETDDTSSLSAFSLTSSQVGVSLGYHY